MKYTLAYVNILVDSYIRVCMHWFVFICFLDSTLYRHIHQIKYFYEKFFFLLIMV